MTRLNMRVCLGLIPVTTAVAAVNAATRRGFIRTVHSPNSNGSFNRYRSRPTKAFPAFSWSSRGWDSGSKGSSTAAAKSVNPGTALGTPQGLAVVPPSLLAAIVAVASDVDGTLTRNDSTVSQRTKDAIKGVMDSGLLFFPATGKVRSIVVMVFASGLALNLRLLEIEL